MDERKEKGMKRKLTDDGRGRYCPCSGTGNAGPGRGPRGALLASATNSWQFCLLSVRRLKREGKGRERESCGEAAEKGRKLGIFVSRWLFHPASPAAAALPFLVSTLPARSVPSLSAAVSFSFCLSVRLSVRPLLLNPRPPTLAFPATSRSEATIDKCRRRWCLVFDLRWGLRHRSAERGERGRDGNRSRR